MKTKDTHKTTTSRVSDWTAEKKLREAWRVSAPQPTRQTLENIQNMVKQEAMRHAQSKQQSIVFQRPFLLAAATIMIILGGISLWQHQGTRDTVWNELAMMEAQIHNEFNALDVQIWDALAELESESPSNEVLLDALAMQMMMREER